MNEVVLQVKGISKSLGGKSILDNCSLNMKLQQQWLKTAERFFQM